ncbi:MAG: hypothetical protein AAFV72_02130 [Cyanobacteria bacterium J06635_1]
MWFIELEIPEARLLWLTLKPWLLNLENVQTYGLPIGKLANFTWMSRANAMHDLFTIGAAMASFVGNAPNS